MKRLMMMTLLLLVFLCACTNSNRGEPLDSSSGTIPVPISLTRMETKAEYTGDDFVGLLKTYISQWNGYTEPIEVTELTTERVAETLDCQVFKELITFQSYILKDNRMIPIGGDGGTGVESIESMTLQNAETPNALLYTYTQVQGDSRFAVVAYYQFDDDSIITTAGSLADTDCTIHRLSDTEFEIYAGVPLETDVVDSTMRLVGHVVVENGAPNVYLSDEN